MNKVKSLSEYKKYYFSKHYDSDWTVHTSNLEGETYRKVYSFADGFQLFEVFRPVYETVETEVVVKGIKVPIKTTVKLAETECWNSEDAESVYFYEKW